MANKKQKRLFCGMNYREVQRSNSDRRSKLPQKKQKWLKAERYKNVGWDNIIALYQKLNDLSLQPDPNEETLEDLFLKADRIGNKYQTPAEIAAFNQQLSVEVNEIADEIDRQFPDTEMEFIDYSKLDRKPKQAAKDKYRTQA